MQGEEERETQDILARPNKRKVSDYLEPDTVLLVSVVLACLLYIVIS
jgi:hypothetical protein